MKKFENKISILVIKLNRRKVFLPTCINKNVTQSINKQDQNCWSTSTSEKKKEASLDKTSTHTSGWESAMERVFKIHWE